MRKIIIGSILVLLLVWLGIFLWGGKEKEQVPKDVNPISVDFTDDEFVALQERFHNESVGFIYQVHALDTTRYLVYTRQRQVEYGTDFPGDQLVWVEKTKEATTVTPLTTGNYPIRLVMDKDKPYFTQDGQFYFVFYEAHGTKELPQNGKGYVYRIDKQKGVEKVYETAGTYENFALDKQQRLVVVEKQELENRNMYPSFFAPYVLKYQQYNEGKWKTIQEKTVEPDLIEEYEKYQEKTKEESKK